MSKAFVKEDADDDEDIEPPEPAGPAPRNYITPVGHARMKHELLHLLDVERPEVVRIVSWAASNGDRSENGDYLYGKKRLREIDRRIRFLTRRLDRAEVVDPLQQAGNVESFTTNMAMNRYNSVMNNNAALQGAGMQAGASGNAATMGMIGSGVGMAVGIGAIAI